MAHIKFPFSRTEIGWEAALRRITCCAAVGTLLLSLSSAAFGAVLEISPSGDVTVHDRPEVFLTDDGGSAPIPAATVFAEPRGAASSSVRSDIRASLAEEAKRHHLSPVLVEAVAWRESGFRQNSVSSKGALGVMQLMPSTARALGVDPTSTSDNIRGGVAYLSQLMRRYDGDIVKSLAAYNASPGAVDKYGGAPPYRETQAYVAAILDRLAAVSAAPPLQGTLK